MDGHDVAEARAELERRRLALIRLAHDPRSRLDPLDRQEIPKYLERWELPQKPDSPAWVLRHFIKSGLTYAPVRKFCTSVLGEIPMPPTMGELLARVFGRPEFRADDAWDPVRLHALAEDIQRQRRYDLDSRKFEPRIVRVLLDGTSEMGRRLTGGVLPFYASVDAAVAGGPVSMWSFVTEISSRVRNVGPALVCDFLKELGFAQFVKVDHHFMKEFPGLVGADDCDQMSPRQHFIVSQELAAALGMTPYHLDRILYEWGRYGT